MALSRSFRSASPSRNLSYALDDLDISQNSYKNFSDPVLRFKSRYSPNLRAALGASDRIQQRVERVIDKKSPRKLVSVNLLLRLVIDLKISRRFFNQSEAKRKPFAPCTCDVFCAFSKLQVVASNFDWFFA